MTKEKVLNGKPYTVNPYMRFDAETIASVMPRRRYSLYNGILRCLILTAFALVFVVQADDAEKMVACLPRHSDILSLQHRIDMIGFASQTVRDAYREKFPVIGQNVKFGEASISNNFLRVAREFEDVRESVARLSEDLRILETRLNDASAARDRETEVQIVNRMKEIMIPNLSFAPPATVVDAVDFFNETVKKAGGGPSFIVKLPVDNQLLSPESVKGEEKRSQIPQISASNVSLYESLRLICKITGFRFEVRGACVVIEPMTIICEDYSTRTYTLTLKDPKRDWRRYLLVRGIELPEDSSISYDEEIHTRIVGKLRVTTTQEGFEKFEPLLDEMYKNSDIKPAGETVR